MTIPKNYFKRKYGPLRGRDWILKIPEEDRAAWVHAGYLASGFGSEEFSRKGGRARARSARRDPLTHRFLPDKESKS